MDVSLKINSYEWEITKPATNKVDITFNNMREKDIDRIGWTGHAWQDDSTMGQRCKNWQAMIWTCYSKWQYCCLVSKITSMCNANRWRQNSVYNRAEDTNACDRRPHEQTNGEAIYIRAPDWQINEKQKPDPKWLVSKIIIDNRMKGKSIPAPGPQIIRLTKRIKPNDNKKKHW